ncbi:alpha/beta hydrolase [Actibacterium sp. 188UL27-1]|nr:alpha/beta hydrolase [Actibacterium sp. 188UL27-1]
MIWFAVILAIMLAPVVAEVVRQPVRHARGPGCQVKLSRGVTHYRWFGPDQGPVIVLVHGLTTPSAVYDAVAVGLAARGARVLSYDLYGRGGSDRPRDAQTRAFFVRQLRELLADQAVKGPITVVGYSMGGVIATAYAARYMEEVERLVLLAPAGLAHRIDLFTGVCMRVPLVGDWLMVLFGPIGLRRGAEHARLLTSQVPGIADVMDGETRMRGYMPAVLSSLRHALTGDQAHTHAALANTGLPVLALWGGADTVIPLEAQARLAQANPAARQIVLPQAGHGLPFTDADRIVAEIAAFALVRP